MVEKERRYHLFNDQGQLVLVADYHSPWLERDDVDHVRLARSDGKLIATLDLTGLRPLAEESIFAIIFDYAVYAIITRIMNSGDSQPYYTIEAEGQHWLALASDQGNGEQAYMLYEQRPGLRRSQSLEAAQMGEVLGTIRQAEAESDFELKLPVGSLRQQELVGLSLVFLLDGA